MLLDKVTCPVMDTDDDEDYDAKSICCVTGFPRTFIDTGVAAEILGWLGGASFRTPGGDFWGDFSYISNVL
ncbi:hypothetical protein XENOCAPTIV_030963 [Xenoophorus captivus]|uniref:Uncharacterized protein n=1 Tax=Xenoophorus captivus TaxID=1517983 RepID=A0ABV0RW97_9TELE